MIKKIKQAFGKLVNMSFINNWLRKHPKIQKQLAKRLSISRFSGVTLTLFVIFTILAFAALFLIAKGYMANGHVVSFDIRIANSLFLLRNTSLLHFFYFITLFAESKVVIFMIFAICLSLLVNKQKLYILTLGLATFLGTAITTIGKHFFQRQRPDIFIRAVTENSFSFPSGHATMAIIFYGFITYLILRNIKSKKFKISSICLFAITVIAIDLSRLYLGVHYFTDVIAGNLVGAIALLVGISATEMIIENREILIKNKVKLSQIFAYILLVVATVSITYSCAELPEAKIDPIFYDYSDVA